MEKERDSEIYAKVAIAESKLANHEKQLNEHSEKIESLLVTKIELNHLSKQLVSISHNLQKITDNFHELEKRNYETVKKEVELSKKAKNQLIFNIISYIVIALVGYTLFKLGLVY